MKSFYAFLSLLNQCLTINLVAIILFTNTIDNISINTELLVLICIVLFRIINKLSFFEKLDINKYELKYFHIINFVIVTFSLILSFYITKTELSLYNTGFILFIILVYVYFNIYSIYEKMNY